MATREPEAHQILDSGTIVEVCVKEGQKVEAGDMLVVFKAMKMHNNIRAPFAGTVKKST